jgi:hypothetical protein
MSYHLCLVRESILNYINTTPHYNLSVIINLIKDLRLLALLLAIFIKRLTNYASNICGLNILIPDTLVRFTTLRIIFIAPFKIKHSFILNAVAVNRKTTFFYTHRTI